MMRDDPCIKIIGVGWAGIFSVSYLAKMNDTLNLYGIDSCWNTYVGATIDFPDYWIMEDTFIPIGRIATRRLGAGACIPRGQAAAMESLDEIKKVIQGADIVILTAGLGGGISSGATPIIAKLCKENGIWTAGIFTIPFSHENIVRIENAKVSLHEMAPFFDHLYVLECDQIVDNIDKADLLKFIDPNTQEMLKSSKDRAAQEEMLRNTDRWSIINQKRANEVMRIYRLLKKQGKA